MSWLAGCSRCESEVEVHPEGWLYDHLKPGSPKICPGSGQTTKRKRKS